MNDINTTTKGKSFSVRPDKLVPYDRNSRIHTNEQVNLIAASIQEFGFLRPVLIDENRMILAGHGATLAAIELGMTAIPVRQVFGLTDDQKRAYVIADNRLSELSSWDWDVLTIELDELQSADADLKPLGFEDFGGERTTTRREHNATIGDGRFLLQLEFENEKDMETVYDELDARGFDIKILE